MSYISDRELLGIQEDAQLEVYERIAVLDPVCFSAEGLDDGCHFCQSTDYGYTIGPGPDRPVTDHDPACLWVQAVWATGRQIHPHDVRH